MFSSVLTKTARHLPTAAPRPRAGVFLRTLGSSSSSSSSSHGPHEGSRAPLAGLGVGLGLAGALYASSCVGGPECQMEKARGGRVAGFQFDQPARHHQYIIIGAGTTANAAVEAIFAEDPHADVLMISGEKVLPPSDALERGVALGADILHSYNEWRRHVTARLDSEPDAFERSPVSLALGYTRVEVDKDNRRLRLIGEGPGGVEHFTFDKLLYANQSLPQKFYAVDVDRERFLSADVINTLMKRRDFEDLEVVTDSLPEGSELAVVGGGFLGTEVALALSKRARKRGFKVYQIYAEKAPLYQYLPEYLSIDLKERLRRHGVLAIPERLVTDLKTTDTNYDAEDDDDFEPFVSDKDNTVNDDAVVTSPVDVIPAQPIRTGRALVNLVGPKRERANLNYVCIASTHIIPDVASAAAAGLEIDSRNGGIITNDQLEAANGIYAAGSLASYYDKAMGRRRRVNRYDHSVNSGLTAGTNMVTSNAARFVPVPWRDGTADNPLPPNPTAPPVFDSGGLLTEQKTYTHQPTFRCFLPELKVMCEVIGEISSDLETVGVFIDKSHKTSAKKKTLPKAIVEWDQISSPEVSGQDDGLSSSSEASVAPLSDVSTTSPYRRGCVYYVRRNRIVGIVLWNMSDQIERARDVLAHSHTFGGANTVARKIPIAPDDWLTIKHVPAKDNEARPLITEDALESLVYF